METPSSVPQPEPTTNRYGGPVAPDVLGTCGFRPVGSDDIGPVCCGGRWRMTCPRGRLQEPPTPTHLAAATCWCEPLRDPVVRPDGSFGALYLHQGPGAETPDFAAAAVQAREHLRTADRATSASLIPSDQS